MERKIKVAILGLGWRGKDTYAPIAKEFPDKMEIAAVADLDKERVNDVAEEYNVPKENCFYSGRILRAG